MSIVREIEWLELHDIVIEFGFRRGSQIYWIHNFIKSQTNENLTRKQLEREIVEILRLCSKSSFDKIMSSYNQIKPHLMTRVLKDKIEFIK